MVSYILGNWSGIHKGFIHTRGREEAHLKRGKKGIDSDQKGRYKLSMYCLHSAHTVISQSVNPDWERPSVRPHNSGLNTVDDSYVEGAVGGREGSREGRVPACLPACLLVVVVPLASSEVLVLKAERGRATREASPMMIMTIVTFPERSTCY